MFRRRDEIEGNDFDNGEEAPRTNFGGFEPNSQTRVEPEMNEEAVETLRSQRHEKTNSLFKTIAQPETTEAAASKTTGVRQAFLSNSPSANVAAAATPKPTTGSPSSRFEGVEAERRLTVGYGITLTGKVSNCDKLIIYGTVDAELDNVKTLHISESGTFKGTANIEQAEISGTFEGDINVKENIIINSTGRVNGKITYGAIEIRPGGKFTGQIVEASENAAVQVEPVKKKAKKQQAETQEFTLAPEPLENEEVVA